MGPAMDPSFLALVVFLIVAVLVAGVVLWPRFRESVQADDPVVPEVVIRLQEGLRQAAEQAPEEAEARVYLDLLRALDHDPREVRRTREMWRERLARSGSPPGILTDLEAL